MKLKVSVRTYVYRPDKAWHPKVMSDCLYDSKGRMYEEKVKVEKEQRPYRMKDYQIEVPH